jgi:hypothetical protein
LILGPIVEDPDDLGGEGFETTSNNNFALQLEAGAVYLNSEPSAIAK